MIYALKACRLTSQQLKFLDSKIMLHFPYIYITQQSSCPDDDSVAFGPLREMRTLKGVSLQYVTTGGCHT